MRNMFARRYEEELPLPPGDSLGDECGRVDPETGHVCTGEIVEHEVEGLVCNACAAHADSPSLP